MSLLSAFERALHLLCQVGAHRFALRSIPVRIRRSVPRVKPLRDVCCILCGRLHEFRLVKTLAVLVGRAEVVHVVHGDCRQVFAVLAWQFNCQNLSGVSLSVVAGLLLCFEVRLVRQELTLLVNLAGGLCNHLEAVARCLVCLTVRHFMSQDRWGLCCNQVALLILVLVAGRLLLSEILSQLVERTRNPGLLFWVLTTTGTLGLRLRFARDGGLVGAVVALHLRFALAVVNLR